MFLLEKELKNSNWESSLKENSILSKHYNWVKNIVSQNNGEITMDILKEEIGKTFSKVLEHAGVFKRDDIGKNAFQKFINTL